MNTTYQANRGALIRRSEYLKAYQFATNIGRDESQQLLEIYYDEQDPSEPIDFSEFTDTQIFRRLARLIEEDEIDPENYQPTNNSPVPAYDAQTDGDYSDWLVANNID